MNYRKHELVVALKHEGWKGDESRLSKQQVEAMLSARACVGLKLDSIITRAQVFDDEADVLVGSEGARKRLQQQVDALAVQRAADEEEGVAAPAGQGQRPGVGAERLRVH